MSRMVSLRSTFAANRFQTALARLFVLAVAAIATFTLAVASDRHALTRKTHTHTASQAAHIGHSLASAHFAHASVTQQQVKSTQTLTDPVIRDLLAGRDARAAVADARAHPERLPTPIPGARPAGSTAFGAYAESLRRLQQALSGARNAWTANARKAAHQQLNEAFAAIQADRLLVDSRIEQIDHLVGTKGLPAAVAARWAPHRGSLEASLSRIAHAVANTASALAVTPADTLPPLDELQTLVDQETKESAPPAYAAATLPVYRPRLAPRDPVMTPVIVPTYADAANDNTPGAADYAATPDAPLSQAILDQAQSLGHDYTRIFDFVRSQVRAQWYAGAQKGAETTLRTLAGNDVDQASLLIALLRASDAPARYVHGVVDVPLSDLESMLGVREDEVPLALSAAGVPNRPIVTAGRISGFAIEQTYVSAYLPFVNYRGTAADLDGRAWIPLMPALKPHAFVPAVGALTTLGIGADAFVEQYLSAPQTLAPLDLLRQQITDGLSKLVPPQTYASQLAQLTVNAPALELLPASLPYHVDAVTGEFAALPEAMRQHAHIVVRSGPDTGDPVVLDQTLAVSQLLDRRVTLAYQPASIDDGKLADQNGGFGLVPPSLIHVRPVLNIAGQPAVAGSGQIDDGATHRVEITIDSPAGTAAMAQEVTAGGIAALVFDGQNDAPPQQAANAALPGDSESDAARVLANFGALYLSDWDQANNELANLVGVSVVRPFPSVALVINQYRIDQVAGVTDALVWRGVGLDAALRPVEPFLQNSTATAANDWLELASLEGSVLEHQLFEQQWSVDSISADKGLAIAHANGQTVLTLTQMTGTSGVNQPQSVLDDISGWLSLGYVVDVPSTPISYEDWTGAVWRVRSLSTGESGYFISGALAGGSTAMPPELWYIQDLAALLGNPYGESPDTDPLSGVAISIDATSQYQDGVVGTVLAQPLRATVIDAAGRPVQGAQVQFGVTTGTAHLVDANGNDAAVVKVATDRNGSASVRVHMDTSQGTFGNFRISPNQTYPQFVGINLIEVAAAASVGTLYSGQPYTEYSLPDAPSKLAFLGSPSITLNPGMGYSSFAANVTDQYGNAVANVPVSLGAATQYGAPSCSDGSSVATVDAALFAPGQCPAGVVQLTGNACATPALTITSQMGGAPFFVVPPATALATVTVTGSAAGATASLPLSTDEVFDPCKFSSVNSVTLWAHAPQYGYVPLLGEYVTLIDAAAPGQVMGAPQRVDAFHAQLVAGNHAGVTWQPALNATFDPQLQNGSIDSTQELGGGSYLENLRAGPSPGPVHGAIYLQWNNTNMPVPGVKFDAAVNPNDLVFAWSVNVQAPVVTPTRIPLTPFGATDATIHIQATVAPPDYVAAPAQIDLLQGNTVIQSCVVPVIQASSLTCDLPRGILIDTTQSYGVRVVLNDGTPFRFESAQTPLAFGQGIVGGYGVLPGSAGATNQPANSGGSGAVDDLALVEGLYPKKLALDQSVDIPSGYSCTVGKQFGFLLERNATVSLVFHTLDGQGNPSPTVAWTALDNVAENQGLQAIAISSADLPIGDYQYELKATASDGTTEDYTGVAAHHIERHDALPLAHPFVKGVDLYSGGTVLSEDDIAIGGRGPGMRLTRTYASHQGDTRSWFGRGWSSDLDAQVIVDDCDTRIVTGSAGQGQRFVPASTDPDGTVHFTALAGYHGTLLQKGAEYDFYAKDGTAYHFGQVDTRGPRLSYVQDTNGNRVAYTYEVNQGAPHVTRIQDAAGRHIDLTYVMQDVKTQQSGITIEDTFTIVSDAQGPGGLHVHYDYDAVGNLIKVTRSDGTSGDRVQGYAYTDLGGIFSSDPDGNPLYFRFGYRLTAATNLLDNGLRSYAYQIGWSGIDEGNGKILYVPEQRVVSVTEPDGGVTGIAYPDVRGLTAVTADVTDARSKLTHYAMNRYGAAETVTDPVGTTQTVWDLTHLEPQQVTDALGAVTTYTYDAAGNKLTETIKNASGTTARSWTYAPQTQFTPPYIRDRIATATDGNNNLAQYIYDTHGNRTQTTRGGITEQDGYDAANGDHISHTDGLGHVWLRRYDTNGTLREADDPLGHATATTFDDRGRELSTTDANGHTTSYTYDARDRILTTTYPTTSAGTGVARSAYDDAADTRTDTNPNNHATVSSFDNMGRLVGVKRADGNTRALQYDKNGNLTQETDFSGNVTKYTYDDANRRTETDAPEGRVTLDAYDALGHVTQETVQAADGSNARVTQYQYAHPLYKRTLVRRILDGSTNADETTQYDAEGRVTQIVDAVGRITKRQYDTRDRLIEEDAPYGKITLPAYYDDDRIKSQTVKNPGHADAVTSYEYDAAGRQTAITDAIGDRRTTGYDNTKNAISRSDARGNLTQFAYDARDELTQQTGPETGQVTTYAYDLAGNRITETWPNGNVRQSAFDSLERRTGTTDAVGSVESFTYTPDDQVLTRTDANGHTTTNHYDGLHRLEQQDLPPVALGARTIKKTYDVHGDVLTETDPGGHTTTHVYDALGRLTSTTLPDVTDAPPATTHTGYDLIDRITSQQDARGDVTTIAYDDSAHTKTQTDPATADGTFTQVWTYDALGNEIGHTDRRGIVTTTAYDALNRVLKITRDGIDTSTRTYQQGLLASDTDAKGNQIKYQYDKAERKIEEDRPLSYSRTWTYTPMNDVAMQTDADKRKTTNTYTPRRYLETVTNNAGETTTYGYDGEGHRTSLQRPMGTTYAWQYVYDEGDRLVSVTDAYGTTQYGYDLDGNKTSQIDANGNKTTYTYDARHHRQSLTYPAITSGAAAPQSGTVQ